MALEALGLHTTGGWLALCLITSVAALLRQHASVGDKQGNKGRWARRRSPSPQPGGVHRYYYGDDQEFRVSEYGNGNADTSCRHHQQYFCEDQQEPSGWQSPAASEQQGSISHSAWQQQCQEEADEDCWDRVGGTEHSPAIYGDDQDYEYAGSSCGEAAEELGCAAGREVGEVPPRLLDPGSLVCLFTAQGELVTVTKEGRHWALRTIASGRETSWAHSSRELSPGDISAACAYEEGMNVASVSFTNGHDDGVRLPFFPIESIFVVLRDGEHLGFRSLG